MHRHTHSDSSTYWRFYSQVGSLRPYPVSTLAHIVKIYGPHYSATPAQTAFRKLALTELDRRAAQGHEEARRVLRDYMGMDKPVKAPTWEEATGTDPNTGHPL